MNSLAFAKLPKGRLLGLMVMATALTGGLLYFGLSSAGFLATKQEPAPVAAVEPVRQVAALGRLEPAGEILQIAAPVFLEGDRLASLAVQVGDWVRQGQVIGVLDSRDRLQQDLRQAQEQVRVAQAKLAQVRSGARQGQIVAQRAEVSRTQAQTLGEERAKRAEVLRLEALVETERVAQEATIARLEAQLQGDRIAQAAGLRRLSAQLRTAQAEAQRNRQLVQEGAISQSLMDAKQLAVEELQAQISETQAVLDRTNQTAQKQLGEARAQLDRVVRTNAAQLSEARAELDRIRRTGESQSDAASATLNQIAEVRPVDIQAAQAEVDSARATAEKVKTDLAKTFVRAPIEGQVLKIHTRAGEKVSSDGIVALGNTQVMMAIAEVYQSDIAKVQLGQKARVSGQAFAGEVTGEVVEIGRQVSRQNTFAAQPGENLDRRVIEVKVKLSPEASQTVANLTNLQVQIILQPISSTPAFRLSPPARRAPIA